jgi:hypothetical protein
MPAPTLAEIIGQFFDAADTFCRIAGPPPAGGNYNCGYDAIRNSWRGAPPEVEQAHRAFAVLGDAMHGMGRGVVELLEDSEVAAQLLLFLDVTRRIDAAEAARSWPALRARLGVIQIRAAAAKTPPPPGAGCRLQLADGRALLDGKEVTLDLTAERRDVALCYLGHLIRMGGDWISDPEVNEAEDERASGLSGTRWDRLRKKLPGDVRCLIETSPKKGARLRPEAWRK